MSGALAEPADIKDGVRPGVISSESSEVRELKTQPGVGARGGSRAGRPSSRTISLQNDYPLVLELAADGIAVTLICRVPGFPTQGFYQWKAGPVTDRDWADAHLINAALEIHDGAQEFG
ncbi:MAG: hypothetical protein ACR2KJ_06955 [Jatrophihabitans sp.]